MDEVFSEEAAKAMLTELVATLEKYIMLVARYQVKYGKLKEEE